MSAHILSQQLLEKILSFVDGETLLVCEKVSPDFEAAVLNLTSKSKWEELCNNEIAENTFIFQLISKLFPHTKGVTQSGDWKLVYEFWSTLKNIPKSVSKCNIRTLRLKKRGSDIHSVLTHGNLILAHIVYFNMTTNTESYKVKIINNMHEIIFTSSRFNSDTLFVTSIDEVSDIDESAVLLYCEMCHLIGIPNLYPPDTDHLQLLDCRSISININNCDDDLLTFRVIEGLFAKSDCAYFEKHDSTEQKNMIHIEKNRETYIIHFDELECHLFPFLTKGEAITCAKAYANLIFLGTRSGRLYVFAIKDKNDIESFQFSNYLWRLKLSKDYLISIDLMFLKNTVEIICTDATYIYQITLCS